VNLFYVYTKPIRKNGKWVMYIITSDDNGIQCDFGFDPDDFSLPDQFVECPKNYEDMPYNVLRREARQQGIKFKKSPSKKDLISELKKQSKPEKPTAEKPKKTKKSEDVELEKEKTKRIEAETKRIEAETKKLAEKNKERELDLRQQELDMEKIQWNLMSVEEYKKRWGKK
jgi:hypothetical protein